MDHYKIIYDENQVREFYRILPRLKPAEVYFLSMSARNKYLSEEERKVLNLGRTEMYAKTIIRHDSEDEFVKHIRRLECDVRGYTTRTGNPIPERCFVCYGNICPSDTIKTIKRFQDLLSEYMSESLNLSLNSGDREKFLNRLNKIDNNLMSYYQQSHSSKIWFDLDIDLNNKDLIPSGKIILIRRLIQLSLESFKLEGFRMISTRSGFHVLILKNQIKFNPKVLCDAITESVGENFIQEVVHNKNEMVPIPGTYQAGYPVSFIN
jgi:hypothetical protein